MQCYIVIHSFDEEDDEEDNFLSFKSSGSVVAADKPLSTTNGFYYQIRGCCDQLFEVFPI